MLLIKVPDVFHTRSIIVQRRRQACGLRRNAQAKKLEKRDKTLKIITRTKKDFRRGAGLALVGVLALSACTQNGDGETPTGDSAAAGSLAGPINADPRTFNPAQATTNADYQVARLGFDTALRRDDEEGIVGGLASDYEASETGVELTIREDAVCSDGTEITPTVVADSLAYLADPDTSSPQAVQIFGSGDITVTADEEAGTVNVETTEPYSELAVGLTHPAAGIICPSGLEDIEALGNGNVEGANSGQYSLTQVESGVAYQFEFNDTYSHWPYYSEELEGHPAQAIELTPHAMETGPNQVLTGEMDFSQLEYHDVERFDEEEFNFSRGSVGEHFLVFNHSDSSPFQDYENRVAAAQAIDQEAYQAAVNPEADLIYSAGDAGVECVIEDPEYMVSHDPDAAAEVLNGLDVRIISTDVIGTSGSGGEYIQEALRPTGANVSLTNTDTGTWVDTILTPDDKESWDVALWSAVNIGGTITNGLSRVVGDTVEEGGRNFSYATNEEADERYREALAAEDEEEACEAFLETQEMVLDEVVFVPLTSDPSIFVSREGVTMRHIQEREDLSTLRIVED